MTLLGGSAFVSGGGSGIGRAIALALASQGAAVAVMDLLPEGGKETVAAIATKGGRATFVPGDVSRWDDVDRAVAAAVSELGPLGIMVNAAGVLDGYAPADEIGPALWERVIGINLTGTFYGSKRALAEMLPLGRGRIVNIASVAGLVGSGGGAAYTASKHGVVGLTRQLAIAYADRGVTVNAICPGYVASDMTWESARRIQAKTGRSYDEALQSLAAFSPQRRLVEPEEVAALAVLLASDEARGVTAQAWGVDGGAVQA